MEDKDFLGYFGKLGPPYSTPDQVKVASQKIVNTLVAITTASGRRQSGDASTLEAEKAIKSKYSTGDLGEKVNADLNYTLKRLIRGLYSENHTVK